MAPQLLHAPTHRASPPPEVAPRELEGPECTPREGAPGMR